MRTTFFLRAFLLPALLAVAAAGCITPPAVLAAGGPRIPLEDYPPGAEEVSVPVEEGVPLRGVFAPSDPGAPVMVTFLGAGDSVAVAGSDLAGLAWDLRDRGVASLALDYRGVGTSGGDRTPLHLRGDARAAYGEAVRRAGGEERVLVRGMSLGTLAAASLLEDGRRPAGLVLVSPVRAETVAVHFACNRYGSVLAFLATPFLRSAGDVDLVGAVRRCPCPLLILRGSADDLLPADEATLVQSACSEAGGRWVERPGVGHADAYIAALRVFPEEEEALARLFPRIPPPAERAAAARAGIPAVVAPDLAPGTPAGKRLDAIAARRLWDSPALAAALAFAGPEPEGEAGRAWLEWMRSLPVNRLRRLPFDALRSLPAFSDPAAPLDPRELPFVRMLVSSWTGEEGKPLSAADLAARAAAQHLGRRATWRVPLPEKVRGHGFHGVADDTFDLDADPGSPPADAPARLSLPRAESYRLAVRLVLKAAGIPERPGNGPVGSPGIEAFENGKWQELELPAVGQE